MSSYCISDIHGHYVEFMQLLDEIGFGDDDRLYVLGDVIDRGAFSAACLRFVYDNRVEAGGNVHFIMGNHEQMMIPHLQRRLGVSDEPVIGHGSESLNEMERAFDYDEALNGLLPWLENLPSFVHAESGGQDYLLVHAGFDVAYAEEYWDGGDLSRQIVTTPRKNFSGVMEAPVHVGFGLGYQVPDAMMWDRSWMERRPGIDKGISAVVIHGHTPVNLIANGMADVFIRIRDVEQSREGGIMRHGKSYDIDCGAGVGSGLLGCLRLDDLEEFYVSCPTFQASSPETGIFETEEELLSAMKLDDFGIVPHDDWDMVRVRRRSFDDNG